MFNGVNLRLSIALMGPSVKKPVTTWVTKYNKWNAEARAFLLSTITYISLNDYSSQLNVIAKIGDQVENSILSKMQIPRRLEILESSIQQHLVYYKNTGVNHWITATDFPPRTFRGDQPSASSRQTTFALKDERSKEFCVCCINSNLFYWLYIVKTNCRDLNPSDIRSFPILRNIEKDVRFQRLASELMMSLDENSRYTVRQQKQTGEIRIQSFRPRFSKPIIDEIDRVLAQHYGFTAEELDFIINYDIKYRLGDALFEAQE